MPIRKVLLFGTAIYNGSIITFDDENSNSYSPIEEMELGTTQHGSSVPHDTTGFIKTEKAMASPALQRSPLIYKQLEEEANDLNTRAKERSTSVGSYAYHSTAPQAASLELESNVGNNSSNKTKNKKGNSKK